MAGDGRIEVTADMVASVVALSAEVGAEVEAGDTLLVVESMKMEIPIEAEATGIVTLAIEEGQTIDEDDLIATIQ